MSWKRCWRSWASDVMSLLLTNMTVLPSHAALPLSDSS